MQAIFQPDRYQCDWASEPGESSCAVGWRGNRGCRATNHGKRHEDFIPSAVEDIRGNPLSYHFLSCLRAFAWAVCFARNMQFYLPAPNYPNQL